MNQADLSKLMYKLRYKIKPRHRNLKNLLGPEGRMLKLRKTVTALFKYERIELNYNLADEARGYADRLVGDAVRYGDCHKATMEMADYWILEKQLIHKLFKVFVPRYKDTTLSYTFLFKAPKRYPEIVYPRSVLEFRGNPFPSLIFDSTRNKNLIHNILLDEARREYRHDKYSQIVEKVTSLENQQKDNNAVTTENSKIDAAKQITETDQILQMIDTLELEQHCNEDGLINNISENQTDNKIIEGVTPTSVV